MKSFVIAAALLLAGPVLGQPVSPLPRTPDEKLAMAREVTAQVLRPGSMREMMSGVMNAVPAQTMNQLMDQRLADLAGLAGVDAGTLRNRIGNPTLRQIMSLIDPAFEERQRRTMEAMGKGMIAVMSKLEPDMREGMAQAYASSFSAEELAAAHAFYSTPLGGAVAARMMTIASNPVYLKAMEGMYPKIMQAMPTMMADAQKATADLPPPRKPEDLSKAERDQLLALLKAGE